MAKTLKDNFDSSTNSGDAARVISFTDRYSYSNLGSGLALTRFLKTEENPGQLSNILQDDPIMNFSIFSHKSDSKAHPLTLDRRSFIHLLSKHQIRPGKDGKLFAPATFTNSRSNRNFIVASGLCLDFDHGQPTVQNLLELFPGILTAYYSTHSNTIESPRFRVVIPLSRPVNADDHALLVLGIKSILPPVLLGCLDTTCFEKARSHYLPSCPPGEESHAFAGHQYGNPLDVENFLALGSKAVQSSIHQVNTSTQATTPADTPHPESASVVPRTFEFIDLTTGEVHDLRAWAAKHPDFDIVSAVDPQYRRGNMKDGKQHITCPFENQHTDQGEDTATFVANASPPQFPAWDVHCCHAHCTGRDRLEFILGMLEKKWLKIDPRQTAAPAPAVIEMRRPPRIYYPVNDIFAAPEWSALLPDERRIAFDLMAMAWAENDGTIADNNWMIARRLGITEGDWMAYRRTLTLTGWLIEAEGRLTNTIVKREFDLAQGAYMKAIIGGSLGGKKSAEKRGAATPR